MLALNIAANTTDCHDVHHYRTTVNILQSCLSTIFLCTWVVLHPDIPEDPYDDFEWMLKRIFLLAVAFFAPEFVFITASEDWQRSALCLERLLRNYPTCEWTEKHALFAYMGGFQLVGEDGSREQLKNEQLFDRIIDSEIDIPEISLQELSDRSKGDGIAKTIVLFQTLWFAIQAANRVAQRLIVTELELTTLAHVFMNIFTYWCWLNKPLNIRFPIDVYRREVEKKEKNTMTDGDEDGRLDNESMHERKNMATDRIPSKGDGTDNPEDNPEDQPDNESGCFLEAPGDKESQVIQPQLPVRVKLAVFLTNAEDRGSWGTLAIDLSVSIVIGMFGAIHCLAWNSSFPTPIESLLWRISSIVVIALPTSVCAVSIIVIIFYGKSAFDKISENGMITLGVIVGLAVPYIFARTCLLVIALTSLRALPDKAYLIPSWTLYMPHFS